MTKKLLVVVGATGNQGGSVIRSFLPLPGWKIRGLTRDIETSSAKVLESKGVEVVSADMDNVESLVKAFHGATAIFGMTDFFSWMRDPAITAKIGTGTNLFELAHDLDLQRGKNLFDAAAKTEGLERLVMSALSYATKWSGGKYRHNYHFDSAGRFMEYGREQYPDLMKKTSQIQIGMFLTNLLHMEHYRPKKNKDGVYIFSEKLPADHKMPLIATDEDTGPLVKALLDAEPGKNLLAYREWMSLGEYTEVWGRTLGVETKYDFLGPDRPWEGLPEWLRADIEEALDYMLEFGFDGGDPTTIHPSQLGVSSEQLGTVADWIAKQDWSAVL